MMIRETAWNTAGIICKLAGIQTYNLRQRNLGFCWGVKMITMKTIKEMMNENNEGIEKYASSSFLLSK